MYLLVHSCSHVRYYIFVPGQELFSTASTISAVNELNEGSGKDWLSFEERNDFRGTCPPPHPEMGGGEGVVAIGVRVREKKRAIAS